MRVKHPLANARGGTDSSDFPFYLYQRTPQGKLDWSAPGQYATSLDHGVGMTSSEVGEPDGAP
jgi:hypothetical protein